MAKGGETVKEKNAPKFAETAEQQKIGLGRDLSAMGYNPYIGPDIASMSALENASYQGTDMLADAFGMPTTGGASYMPEPTTFAGGVQGYSSAPLFDQARTNLETYAPGKYNYLESFSVDPITGQLGSRTAPNQQVALEMSKPSSGGKQEIIMAGGANPQQTVMPGGTNPYQQAAGAQTAAMNRVGQGMYQTAAPGMMNYANPYENQVVQATLRDVGGAASQGLNQLDYQAGQAGAFGGSRHGVAQAQTMQGFNQQALDQTARLRSQGFNTALGASQNDMSNQMNAAGQLAGMGQQSFGYGQAIQNQQMQQGQQQRMMMQSLIDAAKGQYAGYTGAPAQGYGVMSDAASGVANTYGTTETYNPGLFDYLQMGAEVGGAMMGGGGAMGKGGAFASGGRFGKSA